MTTAFFSSPAPLNQLVTLLIPKQMLPLHNESQGVYVNNKKDNLMAISEVLKYLSNFSIYQLKWPFQNSLTSTSANMVHLPQAYVF